MTTKPITGFKTLKWFELWANDFNPETFGYIKVRYKDPNIWTQHWICSFNTEQQALQWLEANGYIERINEQQHKEQVQTNNQKE